MAPRGRPRKPRNTRMDAAVDQMRIEFGFPEELVRRKMKTLLEVYGGEWVFIEADRYAVLLEAILEDTNENKDNEENSTQGENMVDKSAPEEEKEEENPKLLPSVGSSSRDVEQPEPHFENTIRDSGAMENQMQVEDQWKKSEYIEVKKEIVSSPPVAVVVNPPLVEANPPRGRCKPSYGWISDGDDDPDFIELTPMPRLPAAPSATMDDHKQKKRKTRWDVRPDYI